MSKIKRTSAGLRDVYQKLQDEIDKAESVVELVSWGRENVARKKTLPLDWQDILTTRYDEKLADLKNRFDTELREDGEYDKATGELR